MSSVFVPILINMDKVYEPAVIQETPLPNEMSTTQTTANSSDSSSGDVSQPTTITDIAIPRKQVAQETIGETINTKSKKILAAYSFTEQGSIQIGQFVPGVSGDVRVTPNGITARDSAGNTTINMDGDTGDSEFAGKIRGGAFIGGNAGSIVIEENNAGNGRIVLFRGGLASILIGDPA
jgi:hypothetical protein